MYSAILKKNGILQREKMKDMEVGIIVMKKFQLVKIKALKIFIADGKKTFKSIIY